MPSNSDLVKLVMSGSGPGGGYTADEQRTIRDFVDAVAERQDRLYNAALADLPPYTLDRDDQYSAAETGYRQATVYRVVINERTWGLLWPDDGGWSATPWTSNGSYKHCPRRETEREAVADIVAAKLGGRV